MSSEENGYKLNNPSEEQISAIYGLQDKNIIVDSVAGSGKTTLCLHIAKIYKEYKVLLLTYNSKLKLETRQKVELLGLTNMEVHSYHSFCVKYYDHECFTDTKMIQKMKLKNELKPLKNFQYDIIILDEAQDMSPLYFELVTHIIKDNNKNIRLCILGDKNQSIFKFNNADERYITMANQIFKSKFIREQWGFYKLSQSFRVTNEMAEFINNCFLGERRLISRKSNIKPKYIICDSFSDLYDFRGKRKEDSLKLKLFEEVMKLIERDGYGFDDIFILSPSLKNDKSPARKLANRLSENGIPIFVPVSDDTKLDEDLLKGKVVFSSFHQVKGLERKAVMVLNMDKSYFDFYNKDANPSVCPNEVYVAVTRAQEVLILIHHYENDFMPFIDKTKLERYSKFVSERIKIKNKMSEKNIDTNVTDLIKHLPVEVINKCMTYFEHKIIRESGIKINIPLKTKQNDLYEGVSEITGIAIPNYFEFKKTGKMSIFDRCKENLSQIEEQTTPSKSLFSSSKTPNKEVKKDEDGDLVMLEKIDFNNMQPKDILYISNLWNSLKTGYIFKVNQIQRYDWLSIENLGECIKRLEGIVSNKLKTEVRYVVEHSLSEKNPELRNRKLIGHIDCIDNKNVWEFKCVNMLENEHLIQLAVYMYLHKKDLSRKKKTLVLDFMNLGLNEDENDEKEEKKNKIKKKIESLEERLTFLEVMKMSLEEVEHQEGHNIDIIIDNDFYNNCTIIKEMGNREYKVLLKDGKTKKKVNGEDIVRNYTIENCYMKTEKDIMDINNTILKFKKELEKIEVQMQKKEENNQTSFKYYLYNILDDNLIEIESDLKRLEEMMNYLIEVKYFTKNFIKDDEFIAKNNNILDKLN